MSGTADAGKAVFEDAVVAIFEKTTDCFVIVPDEAEAENTVNFESRFSRCLLFLFVMILFSLLDRISNPRTLE
jgi:hypothetical protein